MITIKPTTVIPTHLSKYAYNAQAFMAEVGIEPLYCNVSRQIFIDRESAT